MKRPARLGLQLLVVVVVVALWELVTRATDNPYFPPPSRVVSQLHQVWFTGPATHLWLNSDATANLLPSVGRMFAGWAIAGVIGIVVGVAVGRSQIASDYAEPWLRFGRAVPPAMLVPVFLIIFKLGTSMQIATIAFGALWPVLANAAEGARTVDRVQLDTARAFRLTGPERLRLVILPAAAPKIAAGLRLSISLALILTVVAENTGSTNGIAYELLYENGMQSLDFVAIWEGIIVVGILGYVLNLVFAGVERRLLTWHTNVRTS